MSARKGIVLYDSDKAGLIEEFDDYYQFTYFEEYLSLSNSQKISLTLPLQKDPFKSKQLFSFFDGLIPEGWLLEVAEKNWKLNARDRMGLLLTCCKETIGAVTVIRSDSDE